jgi:ketosteroid isomerase-like protein
MRLRSFIPSPDGDQYNNRAVAILELKWGKLVVWEDYEDTERVAAWDRARSAGAMA